MEQAQEPCPRNHAQKPSPPSLGFEKIGTPILILHGDEGRGAPPRASWGNTGNCVGLTGTAGWNSTFESLPAVQDSAVTSERPCMRAASITCVARLQASRSSAARLFQEPLRERVHIPGAQQNDSRRQTE